MAAIKFSKQYIEPNPNEIDYWVDLSSNQYGGRMKYYNGFEWVDLVNPDGTHIDINDFYNKLQINQMLSQKASVDSVESKVDDNEVSDVIKNISFSQRGEDGVEMVMFKYDDSTVGIQLPIADNTKSGIITKDTFKNLVNQTQLQQLYSEMYTKLSEIRNNYQPKLRAGANIKIENNVISAVSKIGTDWNDIANKPDIYDKSQVDTMMSGVYKIKGSRRFEALPLYGNTVGDTYNITNDFSLHGEDYPLGTNVVWTDNGWDALAGIFDTSELEEDIQEVKDNYLPLAGGIIGDSSNTYPLALRSGGSQISIPLITTNGTYYLGYDANVEQVFITDKGWTKKLYIWHEGNDGNGSGLDADTVDGVHSSDLFVSPNYWQSLGDFNDVDQQGFYAISGENVSNCPVTFGNLILFYNSYSPTYSNAQIVVDAEKHNLQFRHKWDKVWSKWKTIAFTDSDITGNAATATKLATPVKLWGNDFDGSSDISKYTTPTMGAIKFSSITGVKEYAGWVGRIYSGEDDVDLCATGWNYLFLRTNALPRLTVAPNGNIGIGTTDPLYKLDVNGTVSAESVIAGNDTGYHLVDNNGNSIRTLFITKENGLILGHDTASKGYSIRIDGHSLNFRYGTNHAVGMTLNSSGNVTVGESDLAGTNDKLYVDGNTGLNGHVSCRNISARSGESTFSFSNYSDPAPDKNAAIKISGNLYQGSGEASFNGQITSGDLVDWYGVSWSEDSSDPTCTRIGNMALHRSLPILSAMKGYYIGNFQSACPECMLPLNDDWSKLHYNMTDNGEVTVTSFVSGNIMVKIPEFWYIDEYDGTTKTHNLKISQSAKAGWCHHKEAYVGAYEGYDDGSYYKSVKDYIPTVSLVRETLRTKARANGYEDEYKWNIYTYEEHRAICHLFLVEYATRNSQAPVNTALTADGFKQGGLGSGCTTGTVKINGVDTYSFIPTGTTDSLGNGSGQVAYTVTLTDADGNEIGTVTRYANRYRGIENPFGHIWKHVDDIINSYSSSTTNKEVFKCNKPEYFATNKNAKYKPLCSFPGGSKMQGWSKEIKATINCDFFKASAGGNESTYWCDYNYDNDDTSEHCLLIGGNSGNGDPAGLFYFSLANGVGHSYVYIGSRLTYLPWAE